MRFVPLASAFVTMAFYVSSPLIAEDQPPASVTSIVEAATVYLDRAYVTRRAEITLVAGTQTVRFSGLPPELDEQSLRVSVSSGAQIDGVQSNKVFLVQSQEAAIRTLETDLRTLQTQLRELDDRNGALAKANAFVDAVQEAPFRHVTTKDGTAPSRPTVEEYQTILAFISKQRADQAAELRAIDAARDELKPRIDAKRQELAQATGASRLERRDVVISLRSAQAGAAELRLSYLVPGALWVPVYDARADRERTKLDLDYDAVVQQATGEEWTNAQLTLSVARPATLAHSPKPAPYYLTANNVPNMQHDGSFSSRSRAQFQSTEIDIEQRQQEQQGSSLPSAGLYQYKGNRGSKALNDAQDNLLFNAIAVDLISRVVEQRSTSAVFAVPGRHHVASNGKPHRVRIARNSLALSTSLHAIPRVSLNAYITGHAVNTSDMPILPGTVNVFVGNDLIGSAGLDFVAPREVASLYLGIDESVKLSRRLDEKNSGLTFFSKQKRLSFAYSINARNFHPETITIAIYESLPVAQDERITVDLDSPVPKPQANDRGMLRWDFQIEPGKERTASVSYRIEYPNELMTPQLQELELRNFAK